MKRILTLNSKDFYTGVSVGSNVDRGGLWYEANGINPFVDTSGKTKNAGVLQTTKDAVDITNSIAGTPVAYATDLINDEFWYASSGLGNAADGTLAKMALSSTTSPSSEFTSIRGLGTGMGIFQPSGGTRHLYYFDVDAATITQSRLRKVTIDAGTPAQSDVLTDLNFTQTITSTYLTRPMIKYKDGLYFGNVNMVGYVRDDGAGGTTETSTDLDLPDDKLITALSEDGSYLIIAAITGTTLSNVNTGESKIYFYDTNQSSWSREWTIPESVYGLQRVGDAIYAMTNFGIWVFNSQSRPYKIRALDYDQTSAASTPYSNSLSTFNNAVAWGSQIDLGVKVYGEPLQGVGLRGVTHTLMATATTNGSPVSMLAISERNGKTIVGSGGQKLYTYDMRSGGGTGYLAKSVYIPLKESTHIKEFEFTFSEPIDSADKLVVSVIPETLEDEGAWVTATGYDADDMVFNNGIAYHCISGHTSGASTEPGVGASWTDKWTSLEFGTVDGSTAIHLDTKKVTLRGSVRDVENLGFVLGFEGGNPKVREIRVNGTRMAG